MNGEVLHQRQDHRSFGELAKSPVVPNRSDHPKRLALREGGAVPQVRDQRVLRSLRVCFFICDCINGIQQNRQAVVSRRTSPSSRSPGTSPPPRRRARRFQPTTLARYAACQAFPLKPDAVLDEHAFDAAGLDDLFGELARDVDHLSTLALTSRRPRWRLSPPEVPEERPRAKAALAAAPSRVEQASESRKLPFSSLPKSFPFALSRISCPSA